MVDFNKLRKQKAYPVPIDPIEIFRRLPKPEPINDLYVSQAEILKNWFDRRNEESLVIKLHTGGGKTLVGLLIAQASVNETHLPALYLCSTRQLVEQTYLKSQEYGIPAVVYEPGGGVPLADSFLAASKVMICTYEALFNGRSKFGIAGSGNLSVKVGAIIFDDAHVAYSRIRDAFTIRIAREANEEDYSHITNIFRRDFEEIGKLGLFEDTISGREQFSVLEVPYWSWLDHINEVREYIRRDADRKFPFAWPYLRDNFQYSQALLSRDAFVITTYFPSIDLSPTYANCPRKVFMSATIADDSSIIRAFDINKDSAGKPLTSTSLAGVSERMILMPEWMEIDDEHKKLLMDLASWSAKKKDVGTVILTPSYNVAASWSEIGEVAENRDRVSEFILNLQTGRNKGPYIFANRYDGIDLPGDACRLLIFANMPRGANEYENYLANLFEGSSLNNTLAQKIEQGIGRGARGSRDYCVILIFGKDVLSWIANRSNSRFLTRITRAQIEIGKTISENIHDKNEFLQTLLTCLDRNQDWIRFHAETLAELTETDPIAANQLNHAAVEREAFRLWRDANHEKAIARLLKYCEDQKDIDKETKGWILQLAARIAYSWNNRDLSTDVTQP
ncbi:MAG TPA: DEAD/DEAH box helicase [Candidatus Hydrogenedentes bacterium]|nr:DEAD/DEAH box helicase [Candidatus Hydrogenedentota bacterium]